MPRIKKTALISFASYRGEKRDEAVQSVLVSAFQMLKQLAEQGRLNDAYATPLAKFAIGRYREGRPGGVPSSSADVMGEQCKKLGRSIVRNFGLAERITDTFQSESAAADSRYPVHKTVALRIDFFQTWLRQQTPKDQDIIRDLAMGETTNDVAKKFGFSAGRISQLRRQYADSWYSFINPAEETDFLEELRALAEAA